jgi:PncC family amidohydrolase
MSDVEAGVGPAEEIARLLDGRSIACAESFTAGRLATVLACVPGAAGFFHGSMVAYAEAVKREVLGVTAESVLSHECAREMALGAASLLSADVTVSTTGLAGDEPLDGVAPGTVFIGMSIEGAVTTTCYRLTGEPTEICDQATLHALDDLRDALRKSR